MHDRIDLDATCNQEGQSRRLVEHVHQQISRPLDKGGLLSSALQSELDAQVGRGQQAQLVEPVPGDLLIVHLSVSRC